MLPKKIPGFIAASRVCMKWPDDMPRRFLEAHFDSRSLLKVRVILAMANSLFRTFSSFN